MEWTLIFLALGLFCSWQSKKLKPKENEPSQWASRCIDAAYHFQRCATTQERPQWSLFCDEQMVRSFCLAVRNSVRASGYPLPQTEYGIGCFDAMTLTLARAMELAEGDRDNQIRFAAKFHRYAMNDVGLDLYDNPTACADRWKPS